MRVHGAKQGGADGGCGEAQWTGPDVMRVEREHDPQGGAGGEDAVAGANRHRRRRVTRSSACGRLGDQGGKTPSRQPRHARERRKKRRKKKRRRKRRRKRNLCRKEESAEDEDKEKDKQRAHR